jgi:hypothetical protein
VLKVQLAAKAQGFSDVIYLDAVNNTFIEEVSSCNFFVVNGKTIATPALGGSILPGKACHSRTPGECQIGHVDHTGYHQCSHVMSPMKLQGRSQPADESSRPARYSACIETCFDA